MKTASLVFLLCFIGLAVLALPTSFFVNSGTRASAASVSAGGDSFWPTNTTTATNIFYFLGNDGASDLSAVTTWTDLSGSGNTVTNLEGGTTYPTNILNRINGHAIVRFNGVGNYLGASLLRTNIGTVMVVAGNITYSVANAVAGTDTSAGRVRMITWFPNSTTIYSGDAGELFQTGFSNYVNGAFTFTFPASPTFALVDQTAAPLRATNLVIGISAVNDPFKGDIAFMAGWNGQLSTFERRRIETNVCNYFGLTIQP